jgi:methylenetetrahydrofolate reductase (NADPH)
MDKINTNAKRDLQERIESGSRILAAQISPPKSCDPAQVRALARRYCGKVHALGVTDNQNEVTMSALVASSLVASEGVEPILHVVTRDRNRIALISDCLGAQALGIRNILCTTGTHQTLGRYRSARNVFDIDSVHLLQVYAGLASDLSLVGEQGMNGNGSLCLGGVASPCADPMPLQVLRALKKVNAGARFLITQPIFDLNRFQAWWEEITRRGLHEKVAILAGIRVLADAEEARAHAARRPNPLVPEPLLERIASKSGGDGQRAEGVQIALEIMEQLSSVQGLRGFDISGAGDGALEVIEKSGPGAD